MFFLILFEFLSVERKVWLMKGLLFFERLVFSVFYLVVGSEEMLLVRCIVIGLFLFMVCLCFW